MLRSSVHLSLFDSPFIFPGSLTYKKKARESKNSPVSPPMFALVSGTGDRSRFGQITARFGRRSRHVPVVSAFISILTWHWRKVSLVGFLVLPTENVICSKRLARNWGVRRCKCTAVSRLRYCSSCVCLF